MRSVNAGPGCPTVPPAVKEILERGTGREVIGAVGLCIPGPGRAVRIENRDLGVFA